MSGDYVNWLSKQKAAKRHGEGLRPITRGLDYSYTLDFPSDFSADTFKGALRAAPVKDPTATAALAVFSVSVGAFADGVTPVTWSLTKAQVDALPADGDGDAVTTLYFDFLHAPLVGTQYLLAAGYVDILGGVTDAS